VRVYKKIDKYITTLQEDKKLLKNAKMSKTDINGIQLALQIAPSFTSLPRYLNSFEIVSSKRRKKVFLQVKVHYKNFHQKKKNNHKLQGWGV